MATARDLVRAALVEIAVLDPTEDLGGDLALWGLEKLNRLANRWNAQREAIYAESFANYTLTANLSPHTIGPSGTWSVTSRPVSIEGAMLRLTTSSPVVEVPITIRDAQWWADQTVPTLTSTVPTDLYYNPTWPNGSLYFWPVPTTAYGVKLWTRSLLSAFAFSDTFSMPPGYQDALTYTLAEELAPSLGSVSPTVLALVNEKARECRAIIFDNNRMPRRLSSDAPSPSRSGSYYNYLTGQIV